MTELSMGDVEGLIDLADEILSGDQSMAVQLEKLDRYLDSFAIWFGENRERIEGSEESSDLDPSEKELLGELSEKHEAVIARAKELQDKTVDELKTLKIRGKGIRAYTNVLPKRVSITKGKKG